MFHYQEIMTEGDKMNDLKIYEEYYRKKYELVCNLIHKYLSQNKTIALWGAGLRGKAILNVFDPDQKKIRFVYDSDEKKWGTNMPSGHPIVDYKRQDADIVLVANNSLEFRIIYNMKKAEKHAKIINIDNFILGDLEDDNEPTINLKKVRDQKIAAVVVVYNPNDNVINNIMAYVNQVEKLYIHDNSLVRYELLEKKLQGFENVEYFFSSENQGLCVPFNKYYKKAIGDGMDWLITFDQDSSAVDDMIPKMREFVQSAMCTDDMGIVAPTVNELDYSDRDIMSSQFYTYYNCVIQSGAMHRLSMMREVGDYDEKLFIYEADWEYCVRCRLKGYYVIKLNHAVLLHNLDDGNVKSKFINGKTIYIGKFGYEQYYYQYRNALYCYDKYEKIDPLYAMVCKNRMKKLEINAENDSESQIKKDAIKRAKKDYLLGLMGKILYENK